MLFLLKVPDTIGHITSKTFWKNLTAIIHNGLEKEDLTVRTDFIDLLIKNVFTLPRSILGHPKNRDAVGGLIFGTLAVSGLMVRTDPFKFSPISPEDMDNIEKEVYHNPMLQFDE